MSDYYAWTSPTARKPHRCCLCQRMILPGEPYRRCASLVDGSVETFKYCEHCYRVSMSWSRWAGEYEWDPYGIVEWLEDEHPTLMAAFRAHWRYPDGELVPWPFQDHCIDCGDPIHFGAFWCQGCDRRRIERVTQQLRDLRR